MMGLLLVLGLAASARAQSPGVPRRQVPPAVLAEVQLLQSRFELALSTDCDAERCFSKGCTYLDHAVIDRPSATSMPGLGAEPGPGSVEPQEFLTRARCSFAYDDTTENADIQALSRRLQAKLSGGWLVVSVEQQALQPLSPALQEPPAAEPAALAPEPAPVEEPAPAVEKPEEWTAAVAARELWLSLLPHFFWMVGLGLVTAAATAFTWAWRRVGRDSLEEQALLAQLARPEAAPEAEAAEAAAEGAASEDERAAVARQAAAWRLRLEALDAEHPDPELQALIRERLRAGDLPLLARAVLRFPRFLDAFPSGGDLAAAKLELAEHLKASDEQSLPSDAEFFEALSRHALSASLASQGDALVVRSLREDFGTAGLVRLIEELPARTGALLFALSPMAEQIELVRLLSPVQAEEMADQLLQSNRMDPRESAYLFEVLRAARADFPLPPAPSFEGVLDRGAEFEAAAALSVLLAGVRPDRREALFGRALQRFHGGLPSWHREILAPDMLLALPAEARTDLMLEIDLEALAAWLSLLDADARAQLLAGTPDTLRASVRASSAFPSRARQLALAERGRRELARGFQRQLARADLPFERVVRAASPSPGGA